jgi:AraC-like DNA-binding protein
MLAVRIGVSPRKTLAGGEAYVERGAPGGEREFLGSPDTSDEQRATGLSWLAPLSDGAAGYKPNVVVKELGHHQTRLTQLIAVAQEDLNRVHNVVHYAGYAVFVCDSEGVLVYRHDPRIPGERSLAPLTDECGRPFSLNRGTISAAPIFEEDNVPTAFVGVFPVDTHTYEPPPPIVGAAVRASARAIEERQFRARHRSEWIIAGVCHAEIRSDMLLAVDRNNQIVEADRAGRRLLSREEHGFASTLSLWAVFERNLSPRTLPPADDMPFALVCRRTAEKWWALITPPAPTQGWNGLDAAAGHLRPRLDAIGPADDTALWKSSRGGLAPRMLRTVREYIDTHLSSHIEVEVLANTAGLSTWHFSRAFKQSVGMAPHAYVVLRRLQKACELLTEPDLCLAEIALACGFADQSHLTRVFSRKLHSTPGAWRRARDSVLRN